MKSFKNQTGKTNNNRSNKKTVFRAILFFIIRCLCEYFPKFIQMIDLSENALYNYREETGFLNLSFNIKKEIICHTLTKSSI